HLIDLPQTRKLAQKLHESASTGQGEYKAFLDRWNYDAEQRQAIQQAVAEIM
ncbi:MAG: hypothetical protein F6K28_62170, partial [Microcoleus sp. SIO2G3]|nr:hypothetical protein [Microcoleus sp. SIO2G3]